MALTEQVTLAIITGISSVILNVILLARIIVTQRSEATRRRDDLKKTRTEEEAERERREDARWQQQIDTLAGMTDALKKHIDQNGRLIDTINHMQNTADERNKVQQKTQAELVEQGDALDTMQAQMITQTQVLKDHRQEAKPAIDAIQSVPEKLSGVKDELASVRSDLKDLPTTIKDEMKPALDKLDSIENEVKRLEKVVQDMRTELLTAVHAALAQPVTPTPVIVPEAEKPA